MSIDIVAFRDKGIDKWGEIEFKNEIAAFIVSRHLDALPLFKADADMVYDEENGYGGCETYEFSISKIIKKKKIALENEYDDIVIDMIDKIIVSGVDKVYIKII